MHGCLAGCGSKSMSLEVSSASVSQHSLTWLPVGRLCVSMASERQLVSSFTFALARCDSRHFVSSTPFFRCLAVE